METFTVEQRREKKPSLLWACQPPEKQPPKWETKHNPKNLSTTELGEKNVSGLKPFKCTSEYTEQKTNHKHLY